MPMDGANGHVPRISFDLNIDAAQEPILLTLPDAKPTIFSIEFRAFQMAMIQDDDEKLELQGVSSLYDLAVNLEDEKDKVIERLRRLGLKAESLRIASISATDLRG